MMHNRGAIQILEKNPRAGDIIVGDIHGRYDLLQQLINTSGMNRIIITGDLGDRGLNQAGAGSLDVFRLIMSTNAECKLNGKPPKIYSIAGNHEELFLNYSKNRKICKEIENKLILENKAPIIPLDNPFLMAYKEAKKILKMPNNGGAWVFDITIEEEEKIAEYIESLPYILYVKDDKPFRVVHAEMPLSDEEFQARLDPRHPAYLQLSPEEMQHAAWARRRTNLSLLNYKSNIYTYCGHEVLGELRSESGHICLDSGAFATGVLTAIHHQAKITKTIGQPRTSVDAADVSLFLAKIDHYLNSSPTLYQPREYKVSTLYSSSSSSSSQSTKILICYEQQMILIDAERGEKFSRIKEKFKARLPKEVNDKLTAEVTIDFQFAGESIHDTTIVDNSYYLQPKKIEAILKASPREESKAVASLTRLY